MKERLDVLLVKRGLAVSREKAKAVIIAGTYMWTIRKKIKQAPCFRIPFRIEVRGNTLKYVSRAIKAGKSYDSLWRNLKGKGMYGRGFLHRRFYRLYAAERGSKGLCH